jgi:hypothetical protein
VTEGERRKEDTGKKRGGGGYQGAEEGRYFQEFIETKKKVAAITTSVDRISVLCMDYCPKEINR